MKNKVRELESLKASIQRDNTQAKRLSDEIASESLLTDIKLYDDIIKMQDAYSKGKFSDLQVLSKNIYHSCTANRIDDFDANPVRHLKEHESKKAGHVFPYRFDLGQTIQRGHCIICGAPPGVGKTTLALNMALSYAKDQGQHVAYFSWEMSRAHLWIKLFCIDQMVSFGRSYMFAYIETILQTKQEHRTSEQKSIYDNIYSFANSLKEKIHIYECTGKPVSYAVSTLERLYSNINGYPDWVFLDYIQRIRPEQHLDKHSRKDQLEHASWLLTNHCKYNEINWFILSQLNKDGGYKETGALNEDAGMSIILDREKDSDGRYIDGIKITINKSRFSSIGYSEVPFDGPSGAIGKQI